MALKKITENPTLGDTILFELETPDANGCFLENPDRIDNIKIFFVERGFNYLNDNQYEGKIYNEEDLAAAVEAEAIACENPTTENIDEAKKLRAEVENTAVINEFYYNEAIPVEVIGNSTVSAWDSTGSDFLVENVPLDSDENTIFGRFQFTWEPIGQKEGDYFICWTWTPLPAGGSLSAHLKFSIETNNKTGMATPSHYTVPGKYETLLDQYLPEMFKSQLTDNDKTPEVLSNFNGAVAKLFTFIEDLANQIVDLQDANATKEAYLPLLANFFDIKLKTNDPTLWRRQIKTAVPYFKKKGTLEGLTLALAAINVKLNKFTQLWQIVSSYTWQESFVYSGSLDFELEKHAYALDEDNFELYYREFGSSEYQQLTSDYINFNQQSNKSYLTWQGENLSVNPIILSEGDIIRVVYKYKAVPNATEQTLEDYIRTLPLADQRDETEQIYPKKNWNVRLIEEDDILFALIIKNRHPYYDPVVFGKVRTEFAYSENAYNMEEYNGSIRNSINPCDIDRDFIDECSYGQSSKFNLDLEIENLSNEKIIEAQDVIKDYVPFHSVLQTLSFVGSISEFVVPPTEDVRFLIQYKQQEPVLSGSAQSVFNRAMRNGLSVDKILRSDLAESDLVVNSDTGIAYNSNITIVCPEVNFQELGLSTSGDSFVEVLSPSVNSGSYDLSEPVKNTAVVDGVSEPLNTDSFTFRVNNIVIDGSYLCNVYEDNVFSLKDDSINAGALQISSDHDVSQGLSGGAWSVLISAYSATPYTIKDILPNGNLLLNDPSKTLPLTNVESLSYILKDSVGNNIVSSTGSLIFKKRSRVVALSSAVTDIKNLVKPGNYMLIGSTQYKVLGYPVNTDDSFYIETYNEGDLAGINLVVYQRVVDRQIGFFSYKGLQLQTTTDYEAFLEINNGENPPTEDNVLENNSFKENFIVLVGTDYYSISEIDGVNITLSGPDNYWETLGSGGTSVGFSIYQYTKTPFTVQNQAVSFIDRRGKETINALEIYSDSDAQTTVSLMNYSKGGEMQQYLSQTEKIQYSIEWRD